MTSVLNEFAFGIEFKQTYFQNISIDPSEVNFLLPHIPASPTVFNRMKKKRESIWLLFFNVGIASGRMIKNLSIPEFFISSIIMGDRWPW